LSLRGRIQNNQIVLDEWLKKIYFLRSLILRRKVPDLFNQLTKIKMTEEKWVELLKQEGFKNVYIWEDGPNFEYPDHTHEKKTIHVIISGEMFLNDHGKIKKLSVGQRFDIPQGTTHSAKMGPQGCRYLAAE
jgi:mannose-6-phosphate isomerase-like protein (cupin superfamily)